MIRRSIPLLIRRALAREAAFDIADVELLNRFATCRDAAAFTELVERYSPLVWGACRRVLADEHRAEDAFQQTFITLARKAASLRKPERLPGWLYGVARRTAMQHRASSRSANSDLPDLCQSGPSPLEQASGKELIAAIEREIDRLPDDYRTAVLMCWFQNCSIDEAARQLGMSKGRLWGQLKRARECLRQRLARLGYGTPAIMGAGLFANIPASARAIERAVHAALKTPLDPVGFALLSLFPGAKYVAVASVLAASMVGIVTLLPAGDPPIKEVAKKEAEPKAEVRQTGDGFPLPEGAIFRFGNRQMRHPETISGSAVSPDGKYLATLSSSCVVIWDLATLSVKLKISGGYYGSYGFGDPATAVSFFPDSKSVLLTVRPTDRTSISTNDVVEQAQVWDLDTGKKRYGLKGGWSWVAAAWLVNGGKEIAFQSGYTENASIRYVDAKDGRELRVVKTPDSNGGAWIAPDANRIATQIGNAEGIAVMDGKTGETIYSVTRISFVQAALTPDGKRLLYHTGTGIVHVHDVDAKKEVHTFKHPAGKQRGPIQISKDQQTAFLGGPHGMIFRWDLKNNKKLPDVGRHSTWTLSSLALSPDESMLYSMGGDRLIQRWDLKSNQRLPLPEGYMTQTVPIASADGKHIIVCDHWGAVDFWNVQTGKREKQLQPNGHPGIDCLAISPDGHWLAGGRTVQDVQLWDLTDDTVERLIPLVDKPDDKGGDHVKRVEFSADSKVLYTVSGKTGITAWEVPSGKKIWNTPQSGVLLSVDPKGRWLASAGINDLPVKWTLLDAKTGKALRILEVVVQEPSDPQANSYPPYVRGLAFTPDGSRLVSSHYDGTVHLWDPDSGKVLSRARGIPQGQSTLAISPDGRWIGLGRGDRKITIFELASMKEVLTLSGHDSNVRDVVFSRDGRGIVGNADLAPILWSLEPKVLPSQDTTADIQWETLTSAEGAKAFQQQWALIKNPAAAIKLFRDRIKPSELAIDREKFDEWVSALDSPLFRAREVAERDLTRAGMKIPVAWLRTAMANAKGDESPARLKRILSIREKPDPAEWRLGRAVQVLELAGTDEAKALLKFWADSEGSALAVDAKGALSRLK